MTQLGVTVIGSGWGGVGHMMQPGPMKISPGTFVGTTRKQTLFSLLEFLSQWDVGQQLLGSIFTTAQEGPA